MDPLFGPCIDTRVMGKWTTEEDTKLIEAVQKHGKDWVAVAALVPSRTSFQCRRIWTVRLGPAIEGTSPNEGTWTPEEDVNLADAKGSALKIGSQWPRWFQVERITSVGKDGSIIWTLALRSLYQRKKI
jgi:hypothetical protein